MTVLLWIELLFQWEMIQNKAPRLRHSYMGTPNKTIFFILALKDSPKKHIFQTLLHNRQNEWKHFFSDTTEMCLLKLWPSHVTVLNKYWHNVFIKQLIMTSLKKTSAPSWWNFPKCKQLAIVGGLERLGSDPSSIPFHVIWPPVPQFYHVQSGNSNSICLSKVVMRS